jgi:hypothetical protein
VVYQIIQKTVATHNVMVMYQSLPNYKSIDSLKFRLLLPQSLMEKHSFGARHPVHSCPSIEPPPMTHRMTFPGAYSCHQKEGITSKKMFGMHKVWEKDKICLLV